ncbi:MAG TPA: hypothetical protein VKP13_09555, partial [Nitrospira sp.]|nr:hypothetical protein [Nitrospira sp.]
MAFSALTDWKFGDEKGLQSFLLEHYLEHRLMHDALLALGFEPVDYPLQNMDDPDQWLNAHQLVSQSIWTGTGGGQSVDLATLDWKSERQVDDW